jgi:hypothetical protein
MQAQKALECFKNSVGDCGGSSEDQNADRNEDSEGQAHGMSDENEDPIENWNVDISYVTLWKRTCLHFDHALRPCGRPNLK